MTEQEPPTVEALIAQLRDDGKRDLADAMDLVNHRVAALPESEAEQVSDFIDVAEIPLPPEKKSPFILGMVFGTLMERRYPKGQEEKWPCDETDI